jgi:hypothetical protein
MAMNLSADENNVIGVVRIGTTHRSISFVGGGVSLNIATPY